MSALSVVRDLYEAAAGTGANRIPDPGAGGTIHVNKSPAFVGIVSATAEARTLAVPPGPGLEIVISLISDGGDVTLTVTNGYDQAGSTTLTLDDAGDHAVFHSVQIDDDGTDDFEWRLLATGVGGGLSGAVDATTLTVATSVTLADAVDVAINTSTGSKIGTAVGQKIGFWNATPVVQPAGAAQAAVTPTTAITGTDTVDEAATLAAIQAVETLVNGLRTALVNAGIIKGAA